MTEIMTEFHFIRPFWLLSLLPLAILAWYVIGRQPAMTAWSKVCDVHLLPYLIQTKGRVRRHASMSLLLASAIFMIISLAGPTWSRLPVPTYQQIQPRVVVLDMSDAMLQNDLSPDRLSRAKFKLHDLFQHHEVGQFALVVYTGEPFIVSPLTDDGQTINALLSSLTPDILPVEGQQLSSALEQAGQLIKQAGFQNGQLLVLTATTPANSAVAAAKALSAVGIETSIMPVLKHDVTSERSFQPFADAGRGSVIPFSDTSTDLEQWLAATRGHHHYASSLQNDIPVWRDQGRWFLIPALLFLLPACRRGWLQGMNA